MNNAKSAISVKRLLAERAWLHAVARRIVSDEHEAEDLAQDVWVKLLEHPPRAVRSVRAWLARLTRNRSRDLVRSAAARRRLRDVA